MSADDRQPCPLCAAGAAHFQTVDERRYWQCPDCEIVFLDPAQRPDLATERAEYELHDSDLDDPRYRRWLSRLAEPLLERLSPNREGLDYGCGPGPALVAMLGEAGHRVQGYDPAFFPDETLLLRTWDFITCTETAEHFHRPAMEFDRLARLLRPGGWLAIMTRLLTTDVHFATWHYRRDRTHVVFYTEATFRRLADHHGWSCEILGPDVILLHRPEP